VCSEIHRGLLTSSATGTDLTKLDENDLSDKNKEGENIIAGGANRGPGWRRPNQNHSQNIKDEDKTDSKSSSKLRDMRSEEGGPTETSARLLTAGAGLGRGGGAKTSPPKSKKKSTTQIKGLQHI